ncbi:MAG: hypothetical protein ABSB11_03380 [Sedimentisphaerales bacterium]|jgi:lysylphosphatidylglycerol synthetase-like protein (DUF2156 family)
MPEEQETNNIESVCLDQKTSRVGLVSLVLAVAAIPFFYTSIHRIAALHNGSVDVCLVRETPFYNTIHALCSILPAASLTFAILSLIRCRRNRTGFATAIPALAGLLLAFASFTAYFLVLLALAHSRSD